MEAIVTPLGLSGNVTRAGQASHHGFLLQPARELAPNKSKEMQVKPRKKACISLFFLGGIGRFQWVTGEKIKKILSPLCSRPRLWARSRNSIFLPFSHRQAWRGVEFFKWEQYSTDSVFRKAATTFFGFNDAVTGALPSRGQVVTTPRRSG
jgi:hypothetical protein